MVAAAKKSRTVKEPEAEPLNLDEVYEGDALSKLFAESGLTESGEQANVYIYLVKDGVELRVWKGSPDEYNLDTTSKRFGSGEYLVKIYMMGESGRYAIRGTKTHHILLDPDDEKRAKEMREGAPVQQQPQQPAMSPTDLTAAVVAAVKAALPPPAPAVSPLAALVELKPIIELLRPPATAPANDLASALSLAKTIIEIGKGANPGVAMDADGKPDMMTTVLSKGFDMVTEAMAAQRAGAQMGAQAPAPAPALPNPNPGAESRPESEAEMFEKLKQQKALILLEFALERAIKAAEQNCDPDEYADQVYDDIPDDVFASMQTDPTWFDQLAGVHKGVVPYRAWFEGVRAGLIKIYNETELAADALTGGLNGGNLTSGQDSSTNAESKQNDGGGSGADGAVPTR